MYREPPWMMRHTTVSINETEWKTQYKPNNQHFVKKRSNLFKPSIEPITPYIKTKNEKAEHLEISITIDEFRHTLKCTLYQELQHTSISGLLLQPICIAILSDTKDSTPVPHLVVEPRRWLKAI